LEKERTNLSFLKNVRKELYFHLAEFGIYCQSIEKLNLCFEHIFTFLLSKLILVKECRYANEALENIISNVSTLFFEYETLFVKKIVDLMDEIISNQPKVRANEYVKGWDCFWILQQYFI
jgi:hypothetical protein